MPASDAGRFEIVERVTAGWPARPGCFSGQALHAARGDQHSMAQTLYLDAARQQRPEASPRSVLERLMGRGLC